MKLIYIKAANHLSNIAHRVYLAMLSFTGINRREPWTIGKAV
ncbi:hypothetical protein Q4519_20715 [Motilimonas sp. 1_MG-2023]|nr:hypothetical protein [Motilimonas sp. 1_MG-2023]